MSLRFELSREAALQANHPQGLRSGTRCDRVPQMEDPVDRPGTGQTYVITRDGLRPEIHDSAGSFRPDVRDIHGYMRDSEVYDEIVTTLSSTYIYIYI